MLIQEVLCEIRLSEQLIVICESFWILDRWWNEIKKVKNIFKETIYENNYCKTVNSYKKKNVEQNQWRWFNGFLRHFFNLVHTINQFSFGFRTFYGIYNTLLYTAQEYWRTKRAHLKSLVIFYVQVIVNYMFNYFHIIHITSRMNTILNYSRCFMLCW